MCNWEADVRGGNVAPASSEVLVLVPGRGKVLMAMPVLRLMAMVVWTTSLSGWAPA